MTAFTATLIYTTVFITTPPAPVPYPAQDDNKGFSRDFFTAVSMTPVLKKLCWIIFFLSACVADEPRPPAPSTQSADVPPSTAQVPVEQGPKLRPVDEAPHDPTFLVFRNELLEAVRRRDREHLLSVIHPDIRVSFGGDAGIEDFKRYWKLDRPDSELWNELGEVLRLGGTFDGQRFCAPYVYSAYPEDGPDAFESLVTIGKDVPMYDRPAEDRKIVAILEYDIVRVAADDPVRVRKANGWRGVTTASGKSGWVEERFLRSHIDYRACFQQVGRDWKMVLLVAGD